MESIEYQIRAMIHLRVCARGCGTPFLVSHVKSRPLLVHFSQAMGTVRRSNMRPSSSRRPGRVYIWRGLSRARHHAPTNNKNTRRHLLQQLLCGQLCFRSAIDLLLVPGPSVCRFPLSVSSGRWPTRTAPGLQYNKNGRRFHLTPPRGPKDSRPIGQCRLLYCVLWYFQDGMNLLVAVGVEFQRIYFGF